MSRANLTEVEARRRAKRIHDVRYQLALDVTDDEEYTGSVTIEFRSASCQAVHVDYQGREVRSVTINGKPLPVRRRNHRIALPASTLRAGKNRVVIDFATDYDNGGVGLHRAVDPADGRTYLYSVLAPFDGNRLFPCFDQPDLKAPMTLEVCAPSDWVVIGNSPELSHHDQGDARVHRFQATPPLSTYLYSVVAGPWACWRDPEAKIPSRLFATQSMAEYVDVDELFTLTRQCFEFYEGYFERDYPFAKYDQIFCPHFNWGAMENVGSVLHSDAMLFRHRPTTRERVDRADTVAHEMAHMWFGNLVTMVWWNDLWLNESFATYMANLCLAEGTPWGAAAWEHFFLDIKTWALWQDALVTTHPIETDVPDTETTFVNFDGITYGKGASVLKQLAFALGPEIFRQGVAAYLSRYAWGNARREDFMACLAEAAGTDMTHWQETWLQTSGTSGLRARLGKGKPWLEQTPGGGDGLLRHHYLRIAGYRRQGKQLALVADEKVRVEGRRTALPHLEDVGRLDFIDVDAGDDAFVAVRFESENLAALIRNFGRVEDPLARARHWSCLWLTVRAGDLAPVEFLTLVKKHLAVETRPGIVEGVLSEVGTVLAEYLPAPERKRALRGLSRLAWKRTHEAEPGHELQTIWFDFWQRLSEDAGQGTTLTGLLDGTEAVDGLDLDQERRWRLLESLAAAGDRSVGVRLSAELERDPGERGHQAAFRVDVAAPDVAGKELAWRRFLEDEKSPLGLLREGMKAFWRPGQAELLRPYGARYFKDLTQVATGRANFFLDAYIGSMFPSVLADAATLRRARAAKKTYRDAPRALRRGLTEATDELARAVRLRAFSSKP